ncbi:hypothetical protein E2P64_00030 [Candidatus Bathyarchaeota archaeon]|nr:hypothetical protein E2P64_00030 [Candidatus Bathyarchaeota archaeon]
MEKYLPWVLGLLVIAGVFFLWPSGSPSSDNIKEQFEAKIERLTPVFLAQIDYPVPAEDYITIVLLGYPLARVPGVDFELQEPKTKDGEVIYWYSLERWNEAPDFNCSDYSGIAFWRCLSIKREAGASLDYLYGEVDGFVPQTYEDVYRKYLHFEGVLRHKMAEGDVHAAACENFAQVYTAEVPEDLCVARYRARLRQHCLDDSSDYATIVMQEPQTIPDFTCYYLSYIDYKEDVLGITGQ